jgi:hypothetical protein
MVCHVMHGDFSPDFFEVNMDIINIFVLYTLLSLHSNISVPNIQFPLQGCRAILVDKDKNPMVQIISYLAHLHLNLLLAEAYSI